MEHIMALEDYRKLMEGQRYGTKKAKAKKIRSFKLPLLNLKAEHYYELVEIRFRKVKGIGNPPKEPIFPVFTINKKKGPLEWESVERPPLLAHMNREDMAVLIEKPYTSQIENHTQSVERGVATTAQCAKKRRTETTQLMCALSTIDAREKLTGRITHKRFKATDCESG